LLIDKSEKGVLITVSPQVYSCELTNHTRLSLNVGEVLNYGYKGNITHCFEHSAALIVNC